MVRHVSRRASAVLWLVAGVVAGLAGSTGVARARVHTVAVAERPIVALAAGGGRVAYRTRAATSAATCAIRRPGRRGTRRSTWSPLRLQPLARPVWRAPERRSRIRRRASVWPGACSCTTGSAPAPSTPRTTRPRPGYGVTAPTAAAGWTRSLRGDLPRQRRRHARRQRRRGRLHPHHRRRGRSRAGVRRSGPGEATALLDDERDPRVRPGGHDRTRGRLRGAGCRRDRSERDGSRPSSRWSFRSTMRKRVLPPAAAGTAAVESWDLAAGTRRCTAALHGRRRARSR